MRLRLQLMLVASGTAVVGSTALFMPIVAAGTLFDGGLIASSGTFLLHGLVPYRDYWWLYGPLGAPVSAVFTSIFGPSLLLVRLLGLTALVVEATAAYALMRARVPAWAAAGLAIGGACAGITVMGLELTSWALSLAIALTALAVRVNADRATLAGAIIGLAFAARFDLGAYALIASLAWRGDRSRVLYGFGLIAVPLAVWMLATTPIAVLFDQVVWFPVVGQRTFRSVPLPEVLGAGSALIFLSLVVAPKAILVLAATTVVRGRFRDRRLAVVVTFGLLCQLQALTRADYTHQAQAALPGLIALGTAWPNVFALASHSASAGRRLAAAAGFSASVLLAAFLLIFAVASASVAEPNTLSKDDQALFAAVRTVQMNSQRDDPIFVGLTGHRHTFINDMIVYYLANRRPAVRVAMFNPGVTNTTSVQQEMVDDLAESKAPIVVADSRWTDLSETSNDSFTPGATVLDDFLSKTYIPACEFGSFTVLTTSDRVGTTTCAALRPDSMVDALAAVAGR